MSEYTKEFQDFMRRRETAARAYVNGDGALVRALSSRDSQATFFGPRGGDARGGDQVIAVNDQGASNFAPGSESTLEILQTGAGETIAYWVGYQHAKVQLKNKPEPVVMDLRVTEIFHRENGEWKLVHRHADMLAKPEAEK